MTLDEVADYHNIRAFLVIKNDTLVHNYYGEGYDENSLHASYSIAKSFTSALIGIAIEEGLIESERSLVLDYIPELKGIAKSEHLRIEHLLNMTSGIKFRVATVATIYYGNNVSKVLKHIKFEHHPGTRQEYLNINIQLLGLILHRATGLMPSDYLSEKIWNPINTCKDAIWTKDNKGENLTFCCMGATALDYAKFGRLYLNKGNWNGEQIISNRWYNRSIQRDTTEGSSFNYNYCWHIGEKEYEDFMANGVYKQNIYVNPKKNLIIVLLCNKENALKSERVRWRNMFRQIADQL